MKNASLIFSFMFFSMFWRPTNEIKCYTCTSHSGMCKTLAKKECESGEQCYTVRVEEIKYEFKSCMKPEFSETIACKYKESVCELCNTELCNKGEDLNSGTDIRCRVVVLNLVLALLLCQIINF